MKKPVFIFLIFFAFVSCANQKPKHFIYGKWKSTESPNIILEFFADDLSEAAIFRTNGEVVRWNHRYSIVDEKTVKIFHPDSGDTPVSVYAKARNQAELRLECIFSYSSGGKTMIDQPELCARREFSRMKE